MRVVVSLFFILFLGVADNQLISPLLPAIRSQLGKTAQEAGLLFTGYSLCAGLSVLLWGPLSDIFGCRRGLVGGLLLFSFGSLVSFISSDFSMLFSGRVITGMGASMLSLNTITYAADYFPYASRGWAMGSIFSSYFAALILGVPIGSWIGDRLGWNAVFGASGAVAIALLGVALWLLPSIARRSQERFSIRLVLDQAATYMEFVKSTRCFGALLSSFFASAGIMGFLAFVGIWLSDTFRISARQIALVFMASGIAALLASPVAGSLSDRIGKRPQFVVSTIAMAIALVILPNLPWGPALFAVIGSISLAAAFRQGPMEALITEVVPAHRRGSFVALKNSFSQLGVGLSALVSGALFESVGYVGVCLLCAGFNMAAAAGMLFMVRQKRL